MRTNKPKLTLKGFQMSRFLLLEIRTNMDTDVIYAERYFVPEPAVFPLRIFVPLSACHTIYFLFTSNFTKAYINTWQGIPI